MPTETMQFRLAKNPLVKETIIVLEEVDGRKAIIFPKYRIKEEYEHAEIAKEGEVLELTGKWGVDKKTGAPQFFVDKAFNAAYQKEGNNININTGKRIQNLKYGVDVDVDFIIGGLSSYNNKVIVMSQEQQGHEQYFTDGDYYWYKGDKTKAPTSF